MTRWQATKDLLAALAAGTAARSLTLFLPKTLSLALELEDDNAKRGHPCPAAVEILTRAQELRGKVSPQPNLQGMTVGVGTEDLMLSRYDERGRPVQGWWEHE